MKHGLKSVMLSICVCLLLACSVTAETLEGVVKTVHDGDTVVIVGRNTGRVTIRLYGVDAPETRKPDVPGQPYGAMSGRVLKNKVFGKQVKAEVQDRDQYGRVVAVIRLGARDINAEMVAEGLAWAYRHHLEGAYASQYIKLEEQARKERLGLWQDNNPTPPWDFRYKNRRSKN